MFHMLLVLICDVDSKLLQTKGWSAQSQEVLVYVSATSYDHPGQHIDLERCGAPLYTSALLSQLPP